MVAALPVGGMICIHDKTARMWSVARMMIQAAGGRPACGIMQGMNNRRNIVVVAMMLACAIAGPPPASAESLRAALAAAWRGNPQIAAERASQDARLEKIEQARGGWRPQVSVKANAAVGIKQTHPDPLATQSGAYANYNITLNVGQSLYDGGRTRANVKSARAGAAAGRYSVLLAEQKVLLDAVNAYMDVVRDQQIVAMRRRNIQVLKGQLNAARARLQAGEITRTGVAQARAALAKARADYAQARANLAAAKARYRQAIGHAPSRLRFPRRLPRLPRSLTAALARAGRHHPQTLAAAWQYEAAGHGIEAARAGLRPKASLQAQLSLSGSAMIDKPGATQNGADIRLLGVLEVPLYQGGVARSAVREAEHSARAANLSIAVARRAVRQQVVSAWNNWLSLNDMIAAAAAQVRAAKLALDGVKAEYDAGTRTTQDVLNARQTLLSAKVNLVTARASRVKAAYALLAAIGDLTARRLHLSRR